MLECSRSHCNTRGPAIDEMASPRILMEPPLKASALNGSTTRTIAPAGPPTTSCAVPDTPGSLMISSRSEAPTMANSPLSCVTTAWPLTRIFSIPPGTQINHGRSGNSNATVPSAEISAEIVAGTLPKKISGNTRLSSGSDLDRSRSRSGHLVAEPAVPACRCATARPLRHRRRGTAPSSCNPPHRKRPPRHGRQSMPQTIPR